METLIPSKYSLCNKLNNYFKDNIRISFKCHLDILIITKSDLFYRIYILDEHLPSFILNDDDWIIESMRVEHLCNKGIINLINGANRWIALCENSDIYVWA
jgi:hypothetical protein